MAGVFVNRLKRGMRLQTDPTLLYAQEPGVQRLTRAELDRDHPYNTYTRAGLPPTPIALPGRAALQARHVRPQPMTCSSSRAATAVIISPRPIVNIARP